MCICVYSRRSWLETAKLVFGLCELKLMLKICFEIDYELNTDVKYRQWKLIPERGVKRFYGRIQLSFEAPEPKRGTGRMAQCANTETDGREDGGNSSQTRFHSHKSKIQTERWAWDCEQWTERETGQTSERHCDDFVGTPWWQTHDRLNSWRDGGRAKTVSLGLVWLGELTGFPYEQFPRPWERA